MDKPTTKQITKLHPLIRTEVASLINQCNKALTGSAQIRITQGLRSFDEQQKLYAIGRTVRGKKVTNAKPGQSIHNYGLAIDFCLILDGKQAVWNIKQDFDQDRIADWMECMKIFKQKGWLWGGDWKKFPDYPHLEKAGCNDWKVLSGLPIGNDGYVILPHPKKP